MRGVDLISDVLPFTRPELATESYGVRKILPV